MVSTRSSVMSLDCPVLVVNWSTLHYHYGLFICVWRTDKSEQRGTCQLAQCQQHRQWLATWPAIGLAAAVAGWFGLDGWPLQLRVLHGLFVLVLDVSVLLSVDT